MTPCECTDTKQMVICALNRGDGPCLATTTAEPSAAPEPHALNSDALTNTFASLHIDLPKECQDASALANAALAATNSPAVQDLHDGILAGTVTPKNIAAKLTESAIALMAAERIHTAPEGTQSAVNTLYFGALKTNADKLVAALRPAFNEAAAVIQTAGKHFDPDANERDILSAGMEAVEAWHNLAAAKVIMTQIINARATIADTERDHSPAYLHYISGNYTQAQLWQAEAEYTGVGHGLHNLARAGFTLHLNTKAEAQKLAETARTKTEQQQAQAEAARIADSKRDSSLAPQVATGTVKCARCGEYIQPGAAWHLDHSDRTRYLGPSCARCNTSAAGKAAHRYD